MLFADDIKFYKYKSTLESTQDVGVKFSTYDKIIKIGKFEKIKDDIVKETSSDEESMKAIDNLKNLSTEERNYLLKESMVNIAKEEYENEFYEDAKKRLEKAVAYGYDNKDELYVKIKEKIDGKKEAEIAKAEKEKEQFLKEKEKLEQEKKKLEEEKKKNESAGNSNNFVSGNTNNSAGANTNNNYSSGFIISDSHIRYLTEGELLKYSKGDLAIIRNEIYARHGYDFKEKKYDEYFSYQPWYSVNPNFSTKNLSKIEQANIALILKLEKR